MSATVTEEGALTVLRVPGAGPHRGALVLRLGAADGHPHENGAPHLLEHLALAPLLTDPLVTAVVTPLTTVLVVGADSPQAVAERLGEISERLVHITDEDLDRERSVLRAELQHQGGSLVGTVANILYGLRGAGKCALVPFAEQTMRTADLAAFARPFLTRANAAVVLTEDVPVPALALASGPAPPTPSAPAVLGRLPGALESDDFPPAICGALTPSASAAMTATVLANAMLAAVRGEAGLAYACEVSIQPVSRDAGLLCCSCDAPLADAERALALMVAVIERIAREGPSAEELDRARAGLPSPLDHRAMVHWAIEQAEHGLLRGPDAPHAWTLETHLAVTSDDIREQAAALRANALVLGPDGTTPDAIPAFKPPADDRIDGRRFRGRRAPRNPLADAAIIVGTEGVSAEDINGASRTIRASDAALLVEELGGGLSVLGYNGSVITLEPRDLRDAADAIAAVRATFATTTLVPLSSTDQAVADAADGVVSIVSADHVEVLPELLETGETVQCIEEATLKLSAGALVLTDRRLLFLHGMRGTTVDAWRRDQIGEVRLRRPVPGWNYLHVELDGRTRKFGFVSRARLHRAQDALARIAGERA